MMRDEDKTKQQLIAELAELRQQNAELRAYQSSALMNEEKCRAFFEASPDSVILCDFEGKIILCNQQFAIMHGLNSPDDCIGKWSLDFIAPEDRRRAIESIRTKVETHKPTPGVIYTMLKEDGTRFPAEASGSIVLDSEGNPQAIVVFSRDISERMEAQRVLQESESRYREIIAQAGGVAYQYDWVNQLYTFIDEGIEQLTGYAPDEITPELFGSLIEDHILYTSASQAPRFDMYQQAKGNTSTIYRADNRIRTRDGRMVWLADFSLQFFDDKGEFVGSLGMVQDITERKRMEEELMKVQKLESVGVLAGGIAHDLNNFLTAIVGNISLAMMYESPAEKDRRLAEAEKACMQVKDLTQQLLTFSKGGAPILQTSDIAGLLKDSVTFTLSGSNIKCEFSISNDLWPVDIDEGQINQVINNLIINSHQAMPDGGIISISAENIAIGVASGLPLESGAYIRISVEDQGKGISREYLQKIFDPFFTTKQTGSGLGLATSYSIIKRHKGHITVESQMGVGTTFHIYLPASSAGTSVGEAAEEGKAIIGEGRILIMDDEELVRELAGDILTSIGYKVTIAIDGTEAIKLYREAMESGEPYDAAIMDLTIPGGMGGKETIQRLLEIDPEIRAIVSSGYSNDPVMANFREYGFRGFVAKPYKVRELSEVLNKVITETRG